MSNPTDPDRPAESGTEAIAGPPSPQDARGAYKRHAKACPRCQNADRNRCRDGQRLWRAWEGACDDAYRLLAEQAP